MKYFFFTIFIKRVYFENDQELFWLMFLFILWRQKMSTDDYDYDEFEDDDEKDFDYDDEQDDDDWY